MSHVECLGHYCEGHGQVVCKACPVSILTMFLLSIYKDMDIWANKAVEVRMTVVSLETLSIYIK